MKIAVTTEGNQIFQHFGQCPVFTVFTVENGVIREKAEIDASQHGHAGLAKFLKESGVDVVICGGIGSGAKQMLASVGIQLISGVHGDIDSAVASYLSGNLKDLGGSCNHEEHGNDHSCDCKNHCN